MARQSIFQTDWLNDPLFSSWLEQVPNNDKVAKCKICIKTFNLSNMGRRAVSSHMSGAKHNKHICAASQSGSLKCFVVTEKGANYVDTNNTDTPILVSADNNNVSSSWMVEDGSRNNQATSCDTIITPAPPRGVDQQGTSEGGYEDEGWDAEVEGSRLERPGGAYEDTLDLFGRYLASILRQLPDTPCYSLQQKFIDEAISARLSFGPSVPSHRSPSHNAPQPPEDGNKKPPPTDSSRRTKSQSMKARAQKNKASNIPSSAEAPVPNALPARRASPQPAPPLLAVTIKEEVVDDEMCDVLDDQSGGIDIEEQELSSIKPEVDTAFELVMCDGLNQGSTGQRESTVSATSTEKASPFRCLICPKTFVRSSGLRNHYRDKHPDCDPNFKSKPLNENEQQSKRPCLERDLQVSKGSLEHCLMVPGRNPVTTPAQKTLLYLGKPSVSPAGPVPPSHKPSLTSVSSPMPGPSFLPGTNLSQVPIDTKPGPSSVQSQPSSSTQSVQNQPLFLDPQYHT